MAFPLLAVPLATHVPLCPGRWRGRPQETSPGQETRRRNHCRPVRVLRVPEGGAGRPLQGVVQRTAPHSSPGNFHPVSHRVFVRGSPKTPLAASVCRPQQPVISLPPGPSFVFVLLPLPHLNLLQSRRLPVEWGEGYQGKNTNNKN